MPDHNTAPSLLPDGSLGEIVRVINGRESRYQVTPLEYCYLAYAGFGEEPYYPWLIQWAILTRFAGFFNGWARNATSGPRSGRFKTVMERYCAPVNPNFAYDGQPTPDRSSVPCAQLRACRSRLRRHNEGERVRLCESGGGGGRRPAAGEHNIPGRASPVYDEIMCLKGHRPHGNDGNQDKRRRTFDKIRTVMFGGSANRKNREWRRLSETTRLSAWSILTGQMKNPVPGFDNWAACGGRAHIYLAPMSQIERQQHLDRIVAAGARTQTRVRFGLGERMRRGRSIPISNCFHYRTYLVVGKMHIELRTATGINDSRNGQEHFGHYTGTRGLTFQAATEIRGSSGNTPVTQDGLAPTQERPSVQGDSTSNSSLQTTPGETSSLGRNENVQVQLPEESAAFTDLRAWARTMEETLTRELGSGIRR